MSGQLFKAAADGAQLSADGARSGVRVGQRVTIEAGSLAGLTGVVCAVEKESLLLETTAPLRPGCYIRLPAHLARVEQLES